MIAGPRSRSAVPVARYSEQQPQEQTPFGQSQQQLGQSQVVQSSVMRRSRQETQGR